MLAVSLRGAWLDDISGFVCAHESGDRLMYSDSAGEK